MGRGPPRGSRQPRPSPLSQVQSTRISNVPRTFSLAQSLSPSVASLAASEARGDVTLVENPIFWKRFHEAVYTLEQKESAGESERPRGNKVSGYSGKGTWLQQQKREKRRCRLLCVLITTIAIAIIVAVVVVLVVILKV